MACGLYIAGCSISYIVGTFWCRRWLLRHGLRGTVKRGAAFTLAGGVSMAGLAWAGVIGPWAIALPQFVYSFAHGIHQPCGQAAVVGPFPQHAGAASALAGFILAAMAVAVGAWLGVAMNGTVYPLVATVAAMAMATALVAWTLVQKHGEAK
jgi:DHA1 family bicyclomycin/chloramphenicol resistance-like MFS transporter